MAGDFQRQVRYGYWLGWIPLSALVVVLLYAHKGLGVAPALVSGILLSLFYAFICRSSSYMCASLSLSKTRIPRLALIFVSSSLAAAGIWVLAAMGLGMLVPSWSRGLESKFDLLFGLGVAFYLFAVAFNYTVLAVYKARRAELEAEKSRTLAREAQLRALRAQVDPHFLFNSLNSIASLSLSNPGGSREMCLQLAAFLRSTQKLGPLATISLEQELQLVRQYLAIEEQRFADRMQVHLHVPRECQDRRLPPLLLQPLVENAVKHGVSTLNKDAWIRLEARCDSQMLYVSMSNRYDPLAPRAKGTGRGSSLVLDRLRASYGPKASMRLETLGDTWRVELEIPSAKDGTGP